MLNLQFRVLHRFFRVKISIPQKNQKGLKNLLGFLDMVQTHSSKRRFQKFKHILIKNVDGILTKKNANYYSLEIKRA